jgi:alanyl-tRNA synthetase
MKDMNKKALMQEFQKNPHRYWKVKLFDEFGFERRRCEKCGKFFWTLTEQKICNDSTCRGYEFIGKPPTKKRLDFFQTWKAIEKFFVKNGHVSLKPYPLACKWYPLLYFVNAGIVDFYRIENGRLEFEFPANPSILTQPCLRFNDLPNTGINGKSYSCFFMIQQSSLYNEKEGYWKDKATELDFKLLTRVFGIKPSQIVFIEDVWLSPVAFGPSLEYHVQGIELGNIVFTEFEGTPISYKEMRNKVIDMGAGHERFTWITQGTPTSYDAVFGPLLKKLRKKIGLEYDKKFFLNYAKYAGYINVDEIPDLKIAKKHIAKKLEVSFEELEKQVEKLEALYIITEHARGLALALGQGNLPSNVGGGYNLRVILRRALSFIDKFEWPIEFNDVIIWHLKNLRKIFPTLIEREEEILKILDIEKRRYKNTKIRVGKIVERLVGKKISGEELLRLYESEGITPEQLGVEVPSEFYAKVTAKHMGEKIIEEKRILIDVSNLPPTQILYYKPVLKFRAKVLKVSGNYVVLDRTAFYPRSGGQEPDFGFINEFEVIDVEKIGNVIVHEAKNCKLKEGEIVECKIDRKRRLILSKHHTATHIINAAARKVLGKHVWQHSAFKDVDKARLDITHYESLSEETIEKIEKTANDLVERGLPIKIEVLPRGKAERKYGLEIYQGGAILQKELRIVSIGKIDREACSGTHNMLKSTKEVGFIYILRTKRIQDGVVRIEFASDKIALNYLREKERILRKTAKELGVKEKDVPKAIEKLFKRWKKLRKKLRRFKK